MKRMDSLRTRKLTIRVTPEEYAELQKKFPEGAYRSISEWLRDLIFQEPIKVHYRSQSLDDFLPIAFGLKKEMQTAGRNFNQAVRKLHELNYKGDLGPTIEFLEGEAFSLHQKIESIRQTLIKIQETWSQK